MRTICNNFNKSIKKSSWKSKLKYNEKKKKLNELKKE